MDKANITLQANQMNVQNAQIKYQEILEELNYPVKTSTDFLMTLLRDNKDTEYGRKYGFDSIHSVEEYQKRVPVITYDDIADDMERMAAGAKNILTAYPFDHMNETSGTIGKPKKIPMTDRQTQMYLKYNRNYIDGLLAEKLDPSWMKGRAFATAEGKFRREPSGITIGDASSKLAEYVQGGKEQLDNMIRTLYTSPVEASMPVPGTNTRYIHTRFALMDSEITGIITGFYTMVVQYMHYIAENYEMLIDDIENGTINPSVEMPDEVRESLMKKIEPMPERAGYLREVFANGSDFPFVPKVWPRLQYLFGVGKAGFSVFDETLKEVYTDNEIDNIYSGITASEGLFSIPVELNQENAVLATGATFMEFLPIEAKDDFSKICTVDQLEDGKEYEIIATNLCGLYRYRMSDVVEVCGKYRNTPMVKFKYRRNNTVNLAAEKTTEAALEQTVHRTAEELGFKLSDYTLYPDAKSVPARYVFLVQPRREDDVAHISEEPLADCLEKHLREANSEYTAYTKSGRLGKAEAKWLQPESTFLYRDLKIAKGASPSQVKPVRIITNEEEREFFFILTLN